MNILIFTYDYSEKTLASSFRMRNVVSFYKKCDYTVKVISATHDNQQEVISIDSEFIEKRNLFSKIYLRAFYYPDPMAYWVKKVINFLKNNISIVENADKIIVSSPPHSLQIIALWIKSRYPNKQVISDFRDAFVTNHRMRWYTPMHRQYAKKMELEIFKKIDCIIANTKTMKKDFIEKYNSYADKVIYIPNGYVYTENNISEKTSNENIVIGYFGDSYGEQVSNIIYSNVKNSFERNNITFLTAGKGDWNLNEKSNKKLWKHLGIIKQEEVKLAISSCDILLLIMPKGEKEPSPTIPLKAYEYLSSNKVILYFGPKGDCYDLLLSYSNSYCFSLEKASDLYSIIDKIKIENQPRLDFIEKFNFEKIAFNLINMKDFS